MVSVQHKRMSSHAGATIHEENLRRHVVKQGIYIYISGYYELVDQKSC